MNRSKYGAKKIVIDGITFDSKDEGRYYLYLKELKAKDKILNFERQPKYELQPSFKKYGKTHRAITYAPDFLIYHLDGSEELIDVKGPETQQGNMRRKMFDYNYPDLKLTWVARSLKYSQTGWIEYDKLKKIRRENKKCKK
ncbi:DUF1064 domain-containing protein [Clostridium botulinum]|uniref:DUF1064 domain-containing protein n=1 Tax=Clostridium botulinum TaxID=1491 RepID=UPI00035BAC4D|nr:DUF1064 domain-containing protein [Clostridium botulinum]AJD27414.1 hypothetical protein T257_3116 [Clostridium botulinum CDC_297]EPS50159.1 hypothetical protein CFSAN002368_14908 [Clostridium botulinum A1 str. CFSAN002368]MBY6878413.1 DUF1064 domain-containing protein [Clostridium botulinum]MBY6892018.1 DUF1064 domain-containing protein [Clostridium botulinum]MBY6894452.1 DUF1064 domain-containing protein [Clostridium botulinum]